MNASRRLGWASFTQLRREEPPEVGALLDVGDLVGAMLQLLDDAWRRQCA